MHTQIPYLNKGDEPVQGQILELHLDRDSVAGKEEDGKQTTPRSWMM